MVPPNNASKWQMGFNSAFKGLTQGNNDTEVSKESIWEIGGGWCRGTTGVVGTAQIGLHTFTVHILHSFSICITVLDIRIVLLRYHFNV